MKSEDIPELRNLGKKQPRVQQMIMQMAVNTLNETQREIWFLYNNERLTQDEIALKMVLKRDNIKDYIKRIETKLVKFCKANIAAYLLLKVEHKIMNEENE